MGDEYGHTKKGNNNSWSHDDSLNWFQWEELKKNGSFFRFASRVIALRKLYPHFRRTAFLNEKNIAWHGVKPNEPDWSVHSRFIAFTLHENDRDPLFYIAFNSHFESLTLTLPSLDQGASYARVIDTAKESPEDFVDKEHRKPLSTLNYEMAPHSALVFIAHPIR